MVKIEKLFSKLGKNEIQPIILGFCEQFDGFDNLLISEG